MDGPGCGLKTIGLDSSTALPERPRTTGMPFCWRDGVTGCSVVGAYVPNRARTPCDWAIWRQTEAALLESALSLAMINVTGGPLIPPRALIDATHARAPSGAGATVSPIGPLATPMLPSTICGPRP